MSRLAQHAKSCLCKACSAARLAKPTPPDPEQGDIFAAVKTPPARSSLERCHYCGLTREEKEAATGRGEAVCISSCRWADYMPPSGLSRGVERKEEVLTAHDQRRRGTLLWLRRQLATLYVLRAAGAEGLTYQRDPYVTADDAERFLRANPEKDPGGPGAWKGAIFRGDDWQFTGKLVPSVIAENNGRGQRAWRYVGR